MLSLNLPVYALLSFALYVPILATNLCEESKIPSYSIGKTKE
jgi:hypothetical protein